MTRGVISFGAPDRRSTPPDVDLSTSLGALELPAPVLTASGCSAAGREIDQFFDITAIGAVVTKSIMMKARSGRPTPRMAETPSGMLNSIGLQGPGIDAFLDKDLAWLRERGARAVVSIAGSSLDEYTKLAQKLRHVPDVAAIEVNISCPNVENRGLVFACDAAAAAEVISGVRRYTAPGVPVLAKLSPDVTDIVAIAQAVVKAGADGLSMINTALGMVIDTDTLRPALAGITGGLSGPAIRPIAVRCVYQVHAAMPEVPILGMGGIRTGLDALEFVLAGASAVSVGTVTFHDPSAPLRVQNELAHALVERGFSSLSEAVGYAHRPAEPARSALVAQAQADPAHAGEATDPAAPLESGAEG
jgi:dihydroorotate dehydrogenase (NAD+) catalytic subunit